MCYLVIAPDHELVLSALINLRALPHPPHASLCRVVHALHASAPCCTNPAPSAAPAPSSSCVTDLCSAPSSTTPPPPAIPAATISGTQPSLELDTFLIAATCEAQLIQMLLDSQSAASENGAGVSHNADTATAGTSGQQYREHHLLDAVVSRCWC